MRRSQSRSNRPGKPLMGELGRPRRKKPHRTVRTKYIGQRTDALLGEFDIWDAQAKYGARKIIKTHCARFHCATRMKALMIFNHRDHRGHGEYRANIMQFARCSNDLSLSMRSHL